MSRQAYADDDDLAFEQRLLGAGLAEALPSERTEAALLRFAAGVAALQGGVAGAAASGAVAASASTWSRRLLAAKWLTVGVLVGGVATFAWVQRAAAPPVSAPKAATAPLEPAVAPESEPAVPGTVALNLAPEPARPAATEAQRRARPAAASSAASGARPASDLAAEVAALDGIRTALAIGAWQDAEQQLTRYRRNFDQGALRSEAEVLWLETLLAQGNRPAAAAAAERFIAQHPRDPQVARMRALIE